MRPLPAHSLTPLFFGQKKVFRWYIYFQVSNVFIAAECLRLLLGSFLVITLPKCASSLPGGSSQNMFAEVANNVILLIYFSVEALRYIT